MDRRELLQTRSSLISSPAIEGKGKKSHLGLRLGDLLPRCGLAVLQELEMLGCFCRRQQEESWLRGVRRQPDAAGVWRGFMFEACLFSAQMCSPLKCDCCI